MVITCVIPIPVCLMLSQLLSIVSFRDFFFRIAATSVTLKVSRETLKNSRFLLQDRAHSCGKQLQVLFLPGHLRAANWRQDIRHRYLRWADAVCTGRTGNTQHLQHASPLQVTHVTTHAQKGHFRLKPFTLTLTPSYSI